MVNSYLDKSGLTYLWSKIKAYVQQRHVALTQAEYDALTAEEKTNGTVYYITDAYPASSFLDYFYPVGSYYETSDASFDPNTSWGGTWTLETEGQVHVSSGSNYAVSGALTNVSDGGKSSVTLRAAIGAAAGEAASLNYIAKSITALQAAVGTGSYSITGSYATGKQWSHSTPVTDVDETSEDTSLMQPYIVVNRWHRTA